MMPKDRMLVKGNEMVTGTCPLDCDHVDSSLDCLLYTSDAADE